MMRWVVKFALVVLASSAPGVASAQGCVGFGDIGAGDPFCPNVEWVKNRGVTLGCGDGSNYCPTDPVTRLQMAIFMNRLGTALTPGLLYGQDAVTQPTPLPQEQDNAIIMCATSPVAPASYPRKVLVNTMVSLQADGASATFRAFNLVAVNGAGATQLEPNRVAARGTAPPNGWTTVSLTEIMNLDPGNTYVFFLGVRRDQISGQGGTANNIRCQLTATVMNRNGTASPF